MTEKAVSIVVRTARPDDAEALASLIRALARHEGKRNLEHVSTEAVADWAFGPEPVFEALIAEVDGQPAGYLAFYRAFSFFKGGPALLVENLFVAESRRGHGIGRRLIAAAAAEARRRDHVRLELNVRSDSLAARAFYERLGFFAPGETVYRIEDRALATLADAHDALPEPQGAVPT